MHLVRGGFYRHNACRDIDIEIVKIQYLGPDYFKVKINIVKQNNRNFIIQSHLNVKIYRTDLSNFTRIY